jgi:hypothetical protein
MNAIDGGYEFDPVMQGIDSFRPGVCKLEYIDDVLHVHLRRPGLLIGKGGKTINYISNHIKAKIEVHEIILLGD